MKLLKRIWDWILQKPDWETDFLFGGWELAPSHHTTYLKLDMDHFKGMKEAELVPKAPWPEGYDVTGTIIDNRDVFMHDAKWPKPREGEVLPTFCLPASFPLPEYSTEFASRAAK